MGKLARKCLLIATLFSLLGSAFGSEWHLVGESTNGWTFVDKQSIVVTGDYRKVWESQTLRETKILPTTPPKPYLSDKSLIVYDCRNRAATRLQVTYYSKAYNEGESLATIIMRPEDVNKFGEIPPDSVGEALLNFVCANSSAK